MKNYSEKKAFIEATLIAAITTIFAISIVYVPILSTSIILIPVPFMILAYRHDSKYYILSFITFSILIGILTEIFYTGFLVLLFGPMTVAMSYYIKKRREPYAVIGIGTVTSVFSILIMLKLVSYLGNIDIIKEISLIAEGIVNKQVDMLKSMNVDVLSIEEILDYLLMIVPSILVIQSMVAAFGNYYLTVSMLRRFNIDNVELPRFSDFRLPKNIVFGAFIIFVLSYLTKYVESIYQEGLITNVTLIFIFMFFIQGVAVISHIIKRTKTPKPIRIALIVVVFFVNPLLTAVAFIGLIDSVVDMRRIR